MQPWLVWNSICSFEHTEIQLCKIKGMCRHIWLLFVSVSCNPGWLQTQYITWAVDPLTFHLLRDRTVGHVPQRLGYVECWDWSQGFVHAIQMFYQLLSYILGPSFSLLLLSCASEGILDLYMLGSSLITQLHPQCLILESPVSWQSWACTPPRTQRQISDVNSLFVFCFWLCFGFSLFVCLLFSSQGFSV